MVLLALRATTNLLGCLRDMRGQTLLVPMSSKAIMSLQKTLIKQLESYDSVYYVLSFGYLDFQWRDRNLASL